MNKKEFLKELLNLLEKYNVEIVSNMDEGSDMYGVYNLHLEIIKGGANWETLISFEDDINTKAIKEMIKDGETL